ncbi:MAG: hypothetical protein ACK4NS_13325 [Saprospiraceae bacterium]
MKEEIRQLIAEGELSAALSALRSAARAASAADVEKDVAALAGRWEEIGESASDAATRAIISEDALKLLDRLPERGIGERTLKQHILWLTLGVKIWIFGCLYTHWESGGYSTDQFTGALALLIPVLAAYGGLMFQDFLDHRYVSVGVGVAEPRVRRSVQWTVYAVIAGYGLLLTLAIGAKARGVISYAQLSGALAFIESAIGIYVGRIVRVFFPEQKSKLT